MATEKKGITQNNLKILAVITMFIDHFAAIIVDSAAKQGGVVGPFILDADVLSAINVIMRLIGRIAFPIFCFAIVEGFCYTKNVWKYALRLSVFALITEIPFDLAFKKKLFSWDYQSVLMTMLIGLLTLIAIQFVDKRLGKNNTNPGTEKNIINITLQIVALLAGISLADLFNTDYGGTGILSIVIIYYLWKEKRKIAVIASFFGVMFVSIPQFSKYVTVVKDVLKNIPGDFKVSPYAPTIIIYFVLIPLIAAVIVLAFESIRNKNLAALASGVVLLTLMNISEVSAFFALIPMSKYSGERGKKNKAFQYFFYVFYPLHIFLIYLLAVVLNLRQLPWKM